MKICLTCSPGGHLLQILQLKRVYDKYDHFFLTFRELTTKNLGDKERVYYIKNPKRSFFDTFISFFQTLFIFLKEKPDLIISTGAGVTIPICYLAKMFMRKVIYIESFSRINHPSLAGRLGYLVADLFIVQWEPLLKFYKRAKFGGSIF